MRIHVVKELLVVGVLLIPLQGLVIPEVISQGDQEDVAPVQLGLFAVLIQQQISPDCESGNMKKTIVCSVSDRYPFACCGKEKKLLCPWKEENLMSPGAVSPLATEIFHLESSSGPITAE